MWLWRERAAKALAWGARLTRAHHRPRALAMLPVCMIACVHAAAGAADQEDKLESGLRQLNETLGPRLQTVTGKVEQVERRSTKNVADLLGRPLSQPHNAPANTQRPPGRFLCLALAVWRRCADPRRHH